MTSNIGSNHLIESVSRDGTIPERIISQVMSELRTNFRPEFLNRIDEIVIFKPLTIKEITKIVDLQVEYLKKRLADRRIEIELTDAAKEYIARQGYDPVYGARPLKRFIQKNIETPLARKLIAGEIRDNSYVKIELKNGSLSFDVVRVKKIE
jgi:ATP-dependent Clp protease ATP-binding subunit ClpB